MADPGEKRLSQSQIDDMFARLAAGVDMDEIHAEEDSGGSDSSPDESGMSQDELNNLLNGG